MCVCLCVCVCSCACTHFWCVDLPELHKQGRVCMCMCVHVCVVCNPIQSFVSNRAVLVQASP